MNNRIPLDFVIVKGSGQSELTRHAGSYHFALKDASDIHKYNIQIYSSVLYADSELRTLDQIDFPEFGSELMCIMANAEGNYGDTISAGIIYAWLYKDENLTIKEGGFVCELTGHSSAGILENRLREILQDGYEKTFKLEGLYLGEPEVHIEELQVEQRFGNAIVVMCFLNFK